MADGVVEMEPLDPTVAPAPAGPTLTDRAPRSALVVFGLVVVAAAPLYLWLGRNQWFFHDEWDFLVDRDGGSLHDLLTPHNEHWSTLPIIVYRVLWRAVGLRHYVVYQSLSVAAHLTAAVLLRVVMRRAGVAPWIATAAASAFVLFGSGSGNIVWGFQIGFVGSLVFGLLHLVLADHDGPAGRRDALGLLCGLCALMCSGVGVTMVVVVGLAVLIRRGWRGWRRAALHTVPLGLVYLAWWYAFARGVYGRHQAAPSMIGRFARIGVSNGFGRIGQLPGVGLALFLLLLVGLALGYRRDPVAFRRRAAGPLALVGGAVVFFVVSGLGRAAVFGPEFARKSRYAYLAAAFVLPGIAVAVDALVRRWRVLAVPGLVILLIGVPGNLGAVEILQFKTLPPSMVLSLPRLPAAAVAPRSLHPFDESAAQRISVGWLRDGVASGKIPNVAAVRPSVAAELTRRLAIHAEPEGLAPLRCRPLTKALTRELTAGGSVGFRGTVLVAIGLPGGGSSSVTGMDTSAPQRIVTRYGPLTVTVAPYPGRKAEVCDP